MMKAAIASIALLAASPVLAKMPVTEEASVERVRFADDFAPSPDGTQIAYIAVTPSLERGDYEWSLRVRPLADENVSNGRDVYTLRSAAFLSHIIGHSINVPISNVQWLADNRSLLFKRQMNAASEAGEICVVDTRTGEVRTLYSFAGSIGELSAAADGNTAALYLVHPQNAERQREIDRYGLSVDKLTFATLLDARLWQQPLRQIVVLTGLLSGQPAVKVVAQYQHELVRTASYAPRISLAPNGRYLVFTELLSKLPEKWVGVMRYQETQGQQRDFSRPQDFGLLRRLALYDVASGTTRLAFDHPNVTFEPVVWADDGGSFAVHAPTGLYAVNAANLAAGLIASADEVRYEKDPFTGSSSGEILAWDARSRHITVRAGMKAIRSLQYAGGKWQAKAPIDLPMRAAPYWHGDLHVAAGGIVARLESSEIAPELYYWKRGQETQEGVQLTALDPRLRDYKWGRVERVSLKNRYGAKSTGYLVLPVDYEPGQRYPAVLMLKDWMDTFIMDGQHYSTTFPAQALANAGVVVFMAAAPEHEHQPHIGPGQMGYNFSEMATAEAAIDFMQTRGLIDTAKVGVSGFSVTSWQTQFIIAHSTFQFAAASTADGSNLNYVSYTTQNLHGSPQGYDMGRAFDYLYGGPPFGDTLKNWIEYAPAFNTARIRAPVLAESCYVGVLGAPAIEWFTSLHKLGKPVDLYLYPNGEHNLQTPTERLGSLRLNVDWFRFWLQGYEREPPAYDPERYVRWRALREQHQKNERAIAAGKDAVTEYQRELRAAGWLPSS